MRLKSEIFVSALIRRVFSAGGFAAVEKKGAEEAGAIFIRQRLRDGRENLYGPAPQSFAEDEEVRAERRFETRLAGVEGRKVLLFSKGSGASTAICGSSRSKRTRSALS